MKLILASASPRRAKLLADAAYQFEVHPADIDEQQTTAPARQSWRNGWPWQRPKPLPRNIRMM